MRKFLIIILLTMISFLFADHKTASEARNITNNFLNYMAQNLEIINFREISDGRQTQAYYFELAPNGYTIVTSDDNLPPILAYSFTSACFLNDSSDYSFEQFILDDLQLRMQFYLSNKTAAEANTKLWEQQYSSDNSEERDDLLRTFQQWPFPGSTSTDGWLETQWNQSGVFSNFCPLDNSDQRSVVGCVATAMAQILHYHRYVGEVSFNQSDSYESGYGWEPIEIDGDHEEYDFPSFPELNEYLVTLDDHYENGITPTNDDLSALNFSAGISVQMNYSSGGSGAWTELVVSSFLNKYDYDSANWIENEQNNFYNYMINEMKSMRPTEISIYTPGWENGHAINVDGYNNNNFFHLNFGWGTSNNTCWYLLPQGMPSNYSIISGMAYNIEGGEVPVQVTGVVNADSNPAETYIKLEGSHYIYEAYTTDASGIFEIPAVQEGNYLVTAIGSDRIYYDQQEVYIDENNNEITINLINYEAITGDIVVPATISDVYISLYQNGNSIYSTTSATDNYYIDDVLPGEYVAVANMDVNYMDVRMIDVAIDQMEFDFELQEYPGMLNLSYAAHIDNIFTLEQHPVLSCAVKYSSEELSDQIGNAFSQISFIAPFSSTEGTLKAQLWKNNDLIFEKEVSSYNQSENITVTLDNFVIIEPENDYYLGYKVLSTNGNYAYSDNYPTTSGKSALVKTTNVWISLTDYNFLISGTIITQAYAVITGSVNTDIDIDPIDVVVKAGMYKTTPDNDFNYVLHVSPGTYQIRASASGGESAQYNITAADQETINVDLNITQTASTEYENHVPVKMELSNYPNPFNPTTTIHFALPKTTQVKLEIFNVKGQLIKTFDEGLLESGNHQLIWTGKDNQAATVPSGIYLYKLTAGNDIICNKALLLK